MNRKDRLFALMQRLRDGQLHTAEAMAQDLGVSVRTIYRDMEVLAESGVPVEGARGYGYTAQAAITLPPLNLTETELEALHVALAALGASDLPEMSEAARSLSAKIDAILPEDSSAPSASFGFATHAFAEAARGFAHMPSIRAAIRARQKLRITRAGAVHDIRPLHLDYWGRVWTCIAWEETANDFLSLRIDRIDSVTPLPGLFVDEPGKRFADWQARTKDEAPLRQRKEGP
ncbi:helix-turn-helix transcriptional regulator [Tropicibacter naphthalenivorans]|uniref:Bifunctional biotin--[acetyl-CoA-carboxylase] synthetase/biotin operon repressor n=1 Tax=Tropicibacter naphthalenivorans TaxID=441103 RepID=A0A0P1GQV6_9RHOB|nr:YafY family protein [Tropicibacter naphthalenivorans]CUH76970.1 bifunctional biotin--[acetyl-CoA-carboxylase] synthetase/biotin operon repressor [Tropicibacter naphthalenivorans]SMC61895.1 Predicted DNA-binding transcriptional regulator YafY, contains an HTH and WYL domains [Tropicibacter naphthalenivorans]